MSNQPALIYTSGDNARLARMTLEAGWLVGMRSDKTAYVPINFMDVDYRCPNFERHLAMVREHRPQFAVVPDLSHTQIDQADITRALHQAERLQSVMPPGGVVLLVPKLLAQVSLIPQDFALGYSIPSTNGKALYYPWSLQKRRIHLLGGSPHLQMKLYRALHPSSSVISADGNMLQKMAFQFGKYWLSGRWVKHPQWGMHKKDLSFDCIQRSLQNIYQAWRIEEPPIAI